LILKRAKRKPSGITLKDPGVGATTPSLLNRGKDVTRRKGKGLNTEAL